MVFVQIMKDTGVAQAKGNGDLSGLKVREYTDFSEGSMNQTGNKLDLAIQGSGFLRPKRRTVCATRETAASAFQLMERLLPPKDIRCWEREGLFNCPIYRI